MLVSVFLRDLFRNSEAKLEIDALDCVNLHSLVIDISCNFYFVLVFLRFLYVDMKVASASY